MACMKYVIGSLSRWPFWKDEWRMLLRLSVKMKVSTRSCLYVQYANRSAYSSTQRMCGYPSNLATIDN